MIIGAIESSLDQLRPSERVVANFVLSRPSVVIHMSIADLAERAEVSEPTIMRFCKAVGCLGFMEFKLALVRSLERRTITMNRANPAVKGASGLGQALFARVVQGLKEQGEQLPLDRIDDVLELCGSSRAISVFHDGSESDLASVLVGSLLNCHLEASVTKQVPTNIRLDGRIVLALASAQNIEGFYAFCDLVKEQDGKVVTIGFGQANNDLTLESSLSSQDLGQKIVYFMLVKSLIDGIEARLSRTGNFVDVATDMLQTQREIAYGDARRRDRQLAEAHEHETHDMNLNEERA